MAVIHGDLELEDPDAFLGQVAQDVVAFLVHH
jgi:hypothetical protein